MHVNITTDSWLLSSVFAQFDLACELVGYMYDGTVSDELTAAIQAIQRRLAELLGKPYGLQPIEKQGGAKPDDSQASAGSTQGDASSRPTLEDVLDDLRNSGERADAFASAAKGLVDELAAKEAKEKGERHQLTELTHLVGATLEAVQEVTDVIRVIGQRWSEQDSAS